MNRKKVLFGRSLDKLTIAKIQINSAIEMLFEEKHPIPVHTVAMAGSQIVRDLADKRDSKLLQSIADCLADGSPKQFGKHINQAVGFFKHADKQPEALFDGIDERVNEFALLTAILLYDELSKQTLSSEMKVFVAWFFACYPNMMAAELKLKASEIEHFDSMCALSRAEQMQIGLKLLRNA